MNKAFVQQFEALMSKYSELLVGESDEETREKVTMWALYSHVAKSMPALAKHWNELYPDAKEEMKKVMVEIKEMNEKHRAAK
jgi:ferric iron reductase protein FhuF